MTDALTIRRSTEADRRRVERLAELDSARTPEGDVLLAELDGTLIAALGEDDGHAIADPFVPSADALDLLRRVAPGPPRQRWIDRLAPTWRRELRSE